MLKLDVRDGYVQASQYKSRGRGGKLGLWESSAVLRAERLYRIRRLGPRGDLLRVLLFLRDGWGWERVREVCHEGLVKAVHAQASPVVRHLRGATPDGIVNAY